MQIRATALYVVNIFNSCAIAESTIDMMYCPHLLLAIENMSVNLHIFKSKWYF